MTQSQEKMDKIIADLQKHGIQDVELLEFNIENIVSAAAELTSSPRQINDFLSKIEREFVILFNKIGATGDKANSKNNPIQNVQDIILNALTSHRDATKIGIRAMNAKIVASLYNEIEREFKNSIDKKNIAEFADTLADFALKIHAAQNTSPYATYSQSLSALQENCESFFKNFDNEAACQKFIANLEKIKVVGHTQAWKIIKEAAEDRIQNIHQEIEAKKLQSNPESAKENLAFAEDGPCITYLKSTDAKTLASTIYRNMKDNNVILDKNIQLDSDIHKIFPKEIISKMQEIGKELEKRHLENSTFAGKFKHKIEDYASIVINSFSKLLGKKIDDDKLKAAIEECNTKGLLLYSASKEKQGIFTSQLLNDQKTKDVSTTPSR